MNYKIKSFTLRFKVLSTSDFFLTIFEKSTYNKNAEQDYKAF